MRRDNQIKRDPPAVQQPFFHGNGWNSQSYDPNRIAIRDFYSRSLPTIEEALTATTTTPMATSMNGSQQNAIMSNKRPTLVHHVIPDAPPERQRGMSFGEDEARSRNPILATITDVEEEEEEVEQEEDRNDHGGNRSRRDSTVMGTRVSLRQILELKRKCEHHNNNHASANTAKRGNQTPMTEVIACPSCPSDEPTLFSHLFGFGIGSNSKQVEQVPKNHSLVDEMTSFDQPINVCSESSFAEGIMASFSGDYGNHHSHQRTHENNDDKEADGDESGNYLKQMFSNSTIATQQEDNLPPKHQYYFSLDTLPEQDDSVAPTTDAIDLLDYPDENNNDDEEDDDVVAEREEYSHSMRSIGRVFLDFMTCAALRDDFTDSAAESNDWLKLSNYEMPLQSVQDVDDINAWGEEESRCYTQEIVQAIRCSTQRLLDGSSSSANKSQKQHAAIALHDATLLRQEIPKVELREDDIVDNIHDYDDYSEMHSGPMVPEAIIVHATQNNNTNSSSQTNNDTCNNREEDISTMYSSTATNASAPPPPNPLVSGAAWTLSPRRKRLLRAQARVLPVRKALPQPST